MVGLRDPELPEEDVGHRCVVVLAGVDDDVRLPRATGRAALRSPVPSSRSSGRAPTTYTIFARPASLALTIAWSSRRAAVADELLGHELQERSVRGRVAPGEAARLLGGAVGPFEPELLDLPRRPLAYDPRSRRTSRRPPSRTARPWRPAGRRSSTPCAGSSCRRTGRRARTRRSRPPPARRPRAESGRGGSRRCAAADGGPRSGRRHGR